MEHPQKEDAGLTAPRGKCLLMLSVPQLIIFNMASAMETPVSSKSSGGRFNYYRVPDRLLV